MDLSKFVAKTNVFALSLPHACTLSPRRLKNVLAENTVMLHIPRLYGSLLATVQKPSSQTSPSPVPDSLGKRRSGRVNRSVGLCDRLACGLRSIEQISHNNNINRIEPSAIQGGLQYFWIDTCCINKANNAELSNAINSMFR